MPEKPVLGIAAPQPVLGVKPTVADAEKSAWMQRQLASAATYRATLNEVLGADAVAAMEARHVGRYARPVAIRSHRELQALPGTRMIADDED